MGTIEGGRGPVIEEFSGASDDFAGFVEPHLATLTWWAACLAPGAHEHLVQRALSTAWRQRPRFDPLEITERSWLCSVLLQTSRRLDPGSGGEQPLELVLRPSDGADEVDLGRALALLTDSQRRAVECHHLVGLSALDAALVLGCPVDSVGSMLSDARLRLRRELVPTPDEDTGEPADGAWRLGDADRDSAADRSIDVLLHAAGVTFRAEIPAATFDQPSSRISMLGRLARSGLIAAIAAAVVGIVVAGSALVPQSAPPRTESTAPAGSAAVPDVPSSDSPGTTGESTVAAPVDVGPTARPVGSRPAWPASGVLSAFPSVSGAAGGVRMAWEVASGQLLVGIPETLLCNDRQVRLRLDSTTALHLDLYGGVGPDQGCAGDALRVVVFARLPGQDGGQTVVRVTGTTGSLLLPALSGLELDRPAPDARLPSVSSVRTSGTSSDVDVRWQPQTGRLLVSARGCGASATAGLDTSVTVVLRPTEERCPGRPGTITHVIQIPPRQPQRPFSVVVYDNNPDRSTTADVFEVPATELRGALDDTGEAVGRMVSLSGRQRDLLGADRLGRGADNTMYLEFDTPAGVIIEAWAPTAVLVSDQEIRLSRGTEPVLIQNYESGAVTSGFRLDLPAGSDLRQPLTVRIGGDEVVLPAR